MDQTLLVLAIISAVLALVSLVMLVFVLRLGAQQKAEMEALRQAAESSGTATSVPPEDPERDNRTGVTKVGVVLNPTKFDDADAFRSSVSTVIATAAGCGLEFYETTEDDPGRGQAEQALEDGCDLVIAAGGDGTVRMVASAMAGTGVRMGIVPAGTGNLLARNLEIPLNRPESAILAALTGRDKQVDVGWLRYGMSEQQARIAPKHVFLVMAGYGADAEMIGYTDPQMKKTIGWFAYVFGGLRALFGRTQDVFVSLPDGSTHHLKARTVLLGNVGKLPGGIVLMPDATIDNGLLEVLVAGWRGPAGFGQVVTQLVNPRLKAGVKVSTLERYLTTSVRVATHSPQPVQLDGDTDEEATHMIATVDAGALLLRVPSGN